MRAAARALGAARRATLVVLGVFVPRPSWAAEPLRSLLQESALGVPARLEVRGVSLDEALRTLQETSGTAIAYSPSLIPRDRRVWCDCMQATVGQAIRTLLDGTDFEVSLMLGQIVVVRRRSSQSSSGTRAGGQGSVSVTPERSGGSLDPGATPRVGAIAGAVVEARSRAPIAGAQVHLPGTGIGTLTDATGRFVLRDVPAGAWEVRSEVIGYATETDTVLVGPSVTAEVELALAQRALDLDEVVVTGTAGGQLRRAVANVVGSVNVGERLEHQAPPSLLGLLGGEVAGMGVQAGGGNVGTGGTILIRGVGTLTQGSSTGRVNTAPLVYMDGIRINADRAGPSSGAGSSRLNDIAPEEIERIEVIKGPAAATLYGTEASNGVIQIITKKGLVGRPSLSATVREGANWFHDPAHRIPVNYGLVDGRVVSQDLYDEELAAGRPMFRVGHIRDVSLGVRGGSEDLGYFLSLTHDDDQGYMLNNALTRTSARANLTLRVTPTIDLQANLGIVNSDTRFAPDGQGGVYGMFAMFLWGTPASRDTPSRGFMVGPPEAQNEIEMSERVNRATATVALDQRVTDWLHHRLTLGVDVTNGEISRLWPRVPLGGYPVYAGLSDGYKQVEDDRGIDRTLDYSLSATWALGSDVSLMTSVGAQSFVKERKSTSAVGDELPHPSVSTVGAAAQTHGDEDFIQTKSAGLFVQETASWRDQIFLTAALRADAHSAFGATFKAAYYPKLSVSWVVSDAGFWSVDAVESLRLRMAWGRSGLQPAAFAAARTYWPTTGPEDTPALIPGNLGNPDLKPEVGSELEGGLDASLFSGRLGLEVTYYDQTTRDAILAEVVPPSLGFTGSRYINAGTVNNRGIEIQVDAHPVQTEHVAAGLTLTAAHNRNRLVSLGAGRDRIQADTRGRFQHRVGYPLGGYWSKYIASAEWDPANPTKLINITCQGEAPAREPMPCADAPFHYVGAPGPAWQGSVGTTLAFPRLGLELTSTWVYTWKSLRFNTTTWQRDRNTRNSERAQAYLLGTLDPIEAAEIQTFDIEHPWMERDDHVRVRDVTLSYELPPRFLRGRGVSRASVSLSGRNLWMPWVHPTFTAPGLDPEVRRQRDVPWGWEQTQAPLPQSVLLSIRVTF